MLDATVRLQARAIIRDVARTQKVVGGVPSLVGVEHARSTGAQVSMVLTRDR